MDILNDKFFNSGEICKLLRISKATLWNWRTSGKFPPTIQIGTTCRWSDKDLGQMLSKNKGTQNKASPHTINDGQAERANKREAH